MKITPRKTAKKKVVKESKDDMLVARGRLKGLLSDLVESDDVPSPKPSTSTNIGGPPRGRPKRRPASPQRPDVIKLFDRCVNVSRFNDNTPLYPICREWFYDRKKLPNFKSGAGNGPTYYTGREPLLKQLKAGRIDRVAALPPPNDDEEVQKIPFCEPPAMENGLHLFKLDYDWENPIISTEELNNNYKERWKKVREAWNLQSRHYAQRYEESLKVLEAISKNQ